MCIVSYDVCSRYLDLSMLLLLAVKINVYGVEISNSICISFSGYLKLLTCFYPFLFQSCLVYVWITHSTWLSVCPSLCLSISLSIFRAPNFCVYFLFVFVWHLATPPRFPICVMRRHFWFETRKYSSTIKRSVIKIRLHERFWDAHRY